MSSICPKDRLELTSRFSYCSLELIVEDFAGCHNCLGIVPKISKKRRFLYYLLANIFHLNVSFIIVSLELEHWDLTYWITWINCLNFQDSSELCGSCRPYGLGRGVCFWKFNPPLFAGSSLPRTEIRPKHKEGVNWAQNKCHSWTQRPWKPLYRHFG